MKKYLQSLILLFTFIQVGIAQLPNDMCSGALVIFLDEDGKSSLIDAQLEHAHPSYQGANECLVFSQTLPYDLDRWYSFVAKGEVSRVKSFNASFTSVSVYEGECNSASNIGCEFETFSTIVGEKYLIRVMRSVQGTMPSQAFSQFTVESSTSDVNLDCNTAMLVSVGNEIINIAGNYSESGTTSECGYTSEDIWFNFVAPTTGSINIGPSSNSALTGEVYEGTCGGLSHLACIENVSKDVVGLTVGETYYIRIAENQFTNGFTVNESTIVEGQNVTCETAAVAVVGGTSVTIDRRSSNSGYFWFQYTAPASGDIEYDVLNSVECATYLDDCSNLELLQISNSNDSEKRVFGLTPGADYLVRVKSFIFNNTFSFNIDPSSNGEPNNFCISRQTISVSSTCDGSNDISGTFSRANQTGPCSLEPDLWYEVVAPVSGRIDINYVSGNQFEYYWIEPNCESYVEVDKNSLVPGNTYILMIQESGFGSAFTFCLSEGISFVEPNEICQDAIEVFPGTPFIYSSENDQSEELPIYECYLNPGDLWYSFTATSGAVDVFHFGSSLIIELYSGPCGSLTPLNLNDNRIATGLIVGQVYYLRMYSTQDNNFTITITDLPVEANDECADAQLMTTDNFYGAYSYTLGSESIMSCVDQTEPLLDSWYKFTAFTSAISVTGTSDFIIYEGSCGSLQEIGCMIGDIRQVDNLNVGSEYHLRQFGAYGDRHQFYFRQIDPAVNASCAGSIDIPIWEYNYQDATTISFLNGGIIDDSNVCGGLYDKWYDVIGPTDGGIRMISSAESLFIEILDGCNGVQVHCQELTKNEETETIDLVPGVNYKLRISNSSNTNEDINIRTILASPEESDCASAIAFGGPYDNDCDGIVSGTSINAQESIGAFCGSNSANAVFYTITADENANFRFEISNSAASHQIIVFTDCLLNTPVACGLSSVDALLSNGTSYIIAVHPQTEGVTSTFDICAYKPAIVNNGSVGINTNNPQAKLDVNGGIRPGFTTNAIPGNIRWNTDLEVFDGTAWKSTTEWDHEATQDIDMDGQRITNLATPVLPTDAVTKAYVDGFSDTDNSPSNELQQLSISGNNVTLSNGGGTIIINTDDADADPQNEIQDLILNGSNLSLSSSSSGGISINDADSDANNEIQVMTLSNNNLSLSNGGGSISIDDGDSDNTNEIQTLSRPVNSTNIELSNGGGFVNIEDGDSDDDNELQTITKSGNLVTLSNGGGAIDVADFDNDTSNEIQFISKAGSLINLTNGGQVALNDDDSTNEIQTLSRSGNFLQLSQTTPLTSIEDDDADETNELQTLSYNESMLSISILDDEINIYDGDSSSTNEIQFMSKSGPTIFLSQADFVILEDDDPQNEIQNLIRVNNTIAITNSTLGAVSIDDADSDPDNEIQTITRSGSTILLSDSGGSVSVNDNDASASNELISSVSLSGTNLKILEAGVDKSVDLESIATQWNNNGTEIYYNTNNVGLGISNPDEKLDVRGTIQSRMNSSGTSPQLQLVETASGDGARINFQNSLETSNMWTLYGETDNTTSDNNFNLFHTVGGNILQVKGNGDVGINGAPDTDFHLYHGNNGSADGLKIENNAVTASPWWRLYVSSGSSDLRLFSKSQGSTIIGVFNDVTGAYTNPSDRRMKESVRDLHFDWESFMRLGAYSYKFIGATNEKRSIGFMAQDVMQVYPELVDYVKDTDQYLMNYSGLGVVAIKAVQEQQKEIETLKSENKAMKKELNEIKALLEKMIK